MSKKKASNSTINATERRNSVMYKKFVGIYDSRTNEVKTSEGTFITVTDNKPINPGDLFTAPAASRDEVEVVITGFEKGKPYGYISGVINRYVAANVGVIEARNGNYYLNPIGGVFETNILVAPGHLNGAVDGSLVTFLVAGKDQWGKPDVYIEKIFGHKNDANAFVKGVAMKYGLSTEFNSRVMSEVNNVKEVVTEDELAGREDFRQCLEISIDGSDTKDRDDAIRLRVLPNGNYELGVDIADVSYYVSEGSAMDKEAKLRGTSCYAGGQVIPMLEKKLSNGICSLNEGVDRLCMSAIMEFTPQGEQVSTRLAQGVINVNHNMTYSEVLKIFKNDTEMCQKYIDVVPMIQQMRILASMLQKKLDKKGNLSFGSKEAKLIIGDDGKLSQIVKRYETESTKLIQVFMIYANQAVAKTLVQNNYPGVFRVHDMPEEEKIETLVSILEEMGYNVNYDSSSNVWKFFQNVIDQIKGMPEEDYLMELLKRTQKKAKYSDFCSGHFGIALDYYCHFTSPIRRYPDLCVHRAVKAYLSDNEDAANKYRHQFESDAETSSKAEIKADTVEREVCKMYKCRYMKDFIGETFTGKISNVTKNGFYVELENTVEGYVLLGSSNKYYFDDMKMKISNKKTGETYRLGDIVDIEVVDANETKQTIDFQLI
ncbi:MAG: VacB/RNase II family 3'-5' exoribonuclease [Clostridia bacterium]|nr:VacB/RNase II family 3'-5' exoribonuclease [Clostridia bacterium]